MACCVFCD